MTQLQRHRSLLPAAALLLAAPSCKKAGAFEAALPPPARAASVVSTTPLASAPAASTIKLDEVKRTPRPPAPPCLELPGDQGAGLSDLLEQAARDFDRGRYEQALECARDATRLDAGSVAAHHFRGASLAELGQLEEARTAYARALALDPDDAEVLRSAADLYVRRLGSRDDLELALLYLHRALPRAQRARDRLLQKELYLLQAMALDDLGRPAEALTAATRALEFDPKDREARRERGVSLFELCRFDEAKADLERLSAQEPDAWAEHYLGLIAERAQDDVAAAAHFARAHDLDPEAFKASQPSVLPVFSQVVQEELTRLPVDIRQGLARSQFAVEDIPQVSDLVATDPPLSPGILGLFRPPPDGSDPAAKPSIVLYRKNLARAARSVEELHREVRDTLMHEVGHLNGEDDEQLRDRGL